MPDQKSKVYFIQVGQGDSVEAVQAKLRKLIVESQAFGFLKEGDKVAVKLHFGEEGNTGFVRPEYLRVVCDEAKKKKAGSFLTDTNTLYRGRRTNSPDHLKLAYEHGFTFDSVGAQVIIPDDRLEENQAEVELRQKHVLTAKVARIFLEADALAGVAHFKGHIMTGFGGALKNIGMGCATREGKLLQHSHIAPFVIARKCTGCRACVEVCPVKAIILKDGKAELNKTLCIGCSSCIAACKYNAIDIPWEQGGVDIQERMVEFASAILGHYPQKKVFINFATKITQECDCQAKDDPRIVEDIGILLSQDPVSVDKACFDLVVKKAGKDIFKQVHPKRDGSKQLNYACELGLGSLKYDLIDLS